MSEGGDRIGNIQLDLPAERVERGLDQSALARLSGVSRQTLRLIENGDITGSAPTRAKLRKALDSVEPIQAATPPDVSAQLAELRDRLLLQAESIELLNERMRGAEAEIARLRRSTGTGSPGEQSAP